MVTAKKLWILPPINKIAGYDMRTYKRLARKMVWLTALITGMILLSYQAIYGQESIGFTNPGQIYHLEDYRLPDWGYDLLYLDFEGSLSSSTNFNDSQSRSTFGSVSPAYRYYRESEEMIIDAWAFLPLEYRNSSFEDTNDNEQVDKRFRTNLSLGADGKYYFEDEFFAVGNTSLELNSMRTDFESDLQMDYFDRRVDSRIQLSLGSGIGRVRDVTPVIQALRFNERMDRLGIGDLSDQQLQQMAAIFSQRTGFSRVYDRPGRHFWDEISGVAPDQLHNLSFYDAYYLSETLIESTGRRYTGWDGMGMVFIDHQRYSEKREQNETTIRDDDESETRLGFRFSGRVFHNMSLEHMLSARANVGLGMASYSDRDDNERLFQGGFELGHLYNVTDRLLVQNIFANSIENVGSGDDRIDFRIFRFNSSATYYIEDHVALTANLSYVTERREIGNNAHTRNDFGLRVSLRYYFIRTFM